MAERMGFAAVPLIGGLAESGIGIGLINTSYQVRNFIGTPANMERYELLAARFGEFAVNSVISYGVDLGGGVIINRRRRNISGDF